jgi:hypothetical protein
VLQVGAGHIVLRGGGGVSGVLRLFARTFDPAVPPFSLNAIPGAVPELPGGEPVVSQDCLGWPVAY